MEPSGEIVQRVQELAKVTSSGDASAIADFYSAHPGVSLIGTDPDEYMLGYETIVRSLAGETLSPEDTARFEIVEIHAWAERGIGWATGRFQYSGAEPTPARFSVVLRMEQGVWRIVHQHVSLGVRNIDAFGYSTIEPLATLALEPRDLSALHPMAAEDGRVAIMFTDIEDSTLLNNRLGDEHWMRLLSDHDGIVRRAVEAYRGLEIKHLGDGFMLAFHGVSNAARAAAVIQTEMPNSIAEEIIRVRAGIHFGRAVATESDLFGSTVAYAARVASTARGGEILLSHDAIEQLDSDFVVADPFEAPLKGFAGEHRLYRLKY